MRTHLSILFMCFVKVARTFVLVAFGGIISAQTHANVTDIVRFKAEGMVIVWGGSSDGIAARPPQAAAGQSVQITASPLIMTGKLSPLAVSNITPLRSFSDPSSGKTRFFVASNTAFSIDAELDNPAGLSLDELRDIRFDMKVNLSADGSLAFGQNAQYPHSAGKRGGILRDMTFADLTQRTTVFRGNQATAASRGTIADQSVEFEVTATYLNKDIPIQSPTVTLTVFIP